jgi:uncharacterized protein (TIGR03032 family)
MILKPGQGVGMIHAQSTLQTQQSHTEVHCNPEWVQLQKELGFSLLLGTRSMGDLHVIGFPPQGNALHFQVANFPLCMGMALHGEQLAVACQTDVRVYHNILSLPGIESPVYQRCYSPRSLLFTGDLDAHELAFTADGEVQFVAAKYSCIVTPSASHSVREVWRPRFISALLPEDRCHLNGLCMEGGELKYVTCFAVTNETAGWRGQPFNSGVVWCAQTQEAVCTGLVQPHSPRIHNGELYVLNSGAGEFGRIDQRTGQYDCIAFVGGYGRGLSFVGDYAVFGISKPRHDGYIPNFPLHERLKSLGLADRCQLVAVNLKTGDVMQAITFEGEAREFFDTVVIPDCRQAAVLSLDEAQHPGLRVIDQLISAPAAEVARGEVSAC